MKEFFLHLPIIRKRAGRYIVWNYIDPGDNLEQYYKKLYGKTPINERYPKFVALFQDNDTLGEFQNVWGIQEMKHGALHPNTNEQE